MHAEDNIARAMDSSYAQGADELSHHGQESQHIDADEVAARHMSSDVKYGAAQTNFGEQIRHEAKSAFVADTMDAVPPRFGEGESSQFFKDDSMRKSRDMGGSVIHRKINDGASARSGRSSRSGRSMKSPRSGGSSKKVVKKRIVKMMKQGKLVAEKEEILDEEGNVI